MEASIGSIARPSLHPKTRLGSVHLTVLDLENQIRFYQDTLGFRLHWREENTAGLGAGKDDLLLMTENRSASRRRAAGLYHSAFLMPSRLHLARILRRLVRVQAPLQGAADHWFSEAIYLADPEGNGIEVYRDRSREEWPPLEDVYRLGNGPLDLNQLLQEAGTEVEDSDILHPDTILGHIHLRVSDIARSDAFYIDVLGFDRMMNFLGSAGFVSAGGYHHHIAYNVWGGKGIPSAATADAGLREFSIVLPEKGDLSDLFERIRRVGVEIEKLDGGVQFKDPAGILIRLL